MTLTKRVIFMLLFVPLAYSISSASDACALPPDPNRIGASCGATTTNPNTGVRQQTCCWEERVPGKLPPLNKVTVCQTCRSSGTDCDPKVAQFQQPPTQRLPPGVLENLPTLEQAPATPPPLFGGGNDANVPPTGGIEQPPIATTQPTPGGGANVPNEVGSAEQPPASQDDQNDNQGGGLPTIKNQENVPPGGGVAEQPENNDGQEDSSEGAETAGPLT